MSQLLLLRCCFKRAHPLRALFWGALSGILTLFPMSFFLTQAGYPLAINAVTLIISAVLGIPGALALSCLAVFC